MTPARVLVADPPWRFDDHLPGRGRGADKHYHTLPLHEIMRFPLPPLHGDALLFLWRVAALPAAALDVVSAWGFTPKAELVWVKTSKGSRKPAPEGVQLAIGMGHYTRAAHEICLIATRGAPKVRDRAVRSVLFAQRGAHSAKPDTFYALVERLAEGPYAELFARRRRDGWTQYGNELVGALAAPETMGTQHREQLGAGETVP